jgi:uncharacterized protein (TIGR02246 family)
VRPSAEDRAQIDELVARYNRAINAPDRDEFLSVFTEDAVWVSAMGGRMEGRAELAEFFDRLCTDDAFDGFRGGQHWVANRVYDVVGDGRVRTWSNFMFVVPRAHGVHIALQGSYDDTFVRSGDGWLLAERIVTYLGDDQGRWSADRA